MAVLHGLVGGRGFEGRADVRIYPEGPQCVIEIEDDEFGESAFGKAGWRRSRGGVGGYGGAARFLDHRVGNAPWGCWEEGGGWWVMERRG